MLPQAVNGDRLSFIDAAFTSTSATCVTGLIVVDTGTKFSLFGQIVILMMIQLGGLGIMTFSTFFIFLLLGKFSIADRDVIQSTLTQSPIKNIAGLLKTIFLFTLLIELVGALLMTFCFWDKMPFKAACYNGLFHSVSAFCNAGFSLFETSFMEFRGDWRINIVLMVLIIFGGLGFVVFSEGKRYLFHVKSKKQGSFSFHSRIVLTASLILIVMGFLFLLFFEYKNVLAGEPLQNKFLIPLFQSVTARTAGFNTIDISILTNTSLFFLIILMFIGASPGSCGGGIKTSTAAVIAAMLIARFKNRGDVNIANRQIPDNIVSKAISVTFFSATVITVATMLLMVSELGGLSHQASRGLYLEMLFEVVSAFGTVGLSAGTTFSLSTMGKIIILVTMFIGRIGPLTIAIAIGKKKSPRYQFAKEKILIG